MKQYSLKISNLCSKNERIISMEKIMIRTARIEDAKDLLDIYGYYVKNTAVTFEYEVPSEEEFQSRISRTLEKYPYLVAESKEGIVGYAYAGRYHKRAAFAWSAEMAIYLKKDIRQSGIGRALYTKLEDILKEQGVVKTIAHITMPVDEYSDFNSRQFHEKMGYKLTGKFENIGYKFGRWYSTIWMDKIIGELEEDMEEVKLFEEVRRKFGL